MKRNPLPPVWPALTLGMLAWLVLAAPGQEKRDATKSITVDGRITKVQVEDDSFALRTTQGQDLKLHVDGGTDLRMAQRQATLRDFRVGTPVRVTYQPTAGKNRVLVMTDAAATVADVARETREALAAAKSYTFRQKDEYQRKLEAVLGKLGNRIEDLKKQAEQAGAEARQEYSKQLEELRRLRERAAERLANVKAASPDAWEEIKAGVGAAMEELQQAYERARSHFR